MKRTKSVVLICLTILILIFGSCGKSPNSSKTPMDTNLSADNNSTPFDEHPADTQKDKDKDIDNNLTDNHHEEENDNGAPPTQDEPHKAQDPDTPFETEPEEYYDTDDNLRHLVLADLDGDGKEDIIQIFFPYDPYGSFYEYTLKINESKGNFFGDQVEPQFNVVDIVKGDGFKEVAVSEYGPSDDYMTAFYHYDGKNIKLIGEIQGFYGDSPWGFTGNVQIDGTGLIRTRTRGQIMQTWFYDDEYMLEKDLTLKNIPKDLYLMDTEVTMLTKFTLRKSRTDDSAGITLNPGDKVVLKETDNNRWCSVVNSQGEVGWFEIQGFNRIKDLNLPAEEVFDGLCFAD